MPDTLLSDSILKSTRSTLIGNVERVSFFHHESGECILHIRKNSNFNNMAPMLKSVACHKAWAFPGLAVIAETNGVGQIDEKTVRLTTPQDETNLRIFLKSAAISQIGPKLSRVLAHKFPETLFHILDESPEQLLEVSGIGHKKQQRIVLAWQEYKKKIETLDFLFEQKFPLSWLDILWPHHGIHSLHFLKTSPYQAASRFHLNFDLVDQFALNHGFLLEDPERLRCGLYQTLRNYYKQGHCAYPEDIVLKDCAALLDVPTESLDQVLEIEILQESMIIDTVRGVSCLYLKDLWELERKVAKKLLQFQFREPPWGWFNSRKVLGWAQGILNIELDPLQKDAIEAALSSSMTVITGGPGTGKTTLIRSFVTILKTQFLHFALCSPTGRAAQRLGESSNMQAQTIHRLLKYDGRTGQFRYNENHPLDLELVLVDEASMLDLSLMFDLLKALPEKCALIFVGDADQIPSVGAGNVLYSLIASPHFKVVRLKEIYRQSQNSLIIKNAQRVNRGELPLAFEKGDFEYFPVEGPEEARKVLQQIVEKVGLQKDGTKKWEEVQILTPLNNGPMGTQELNVFLQNEMNPLKKTIDGEELQLELKNSNSLNVLDYFRLNDKVMIVKNDYQKDVFNGDIGIITLINYREQYIEVKIAERYVLFDISEMDRLTLAYAISIHKAQGSEYKIVIIILMEEHLSIVQKHLLYTAVTRGKEKVILIAQESALKSALQKVERRWEKLTELLQEIS